MTDRAQSNRTRPQPAPGTPANVAGHQLAVAAEWLSRGYPVIPLHSVKKRPLVGGFSRDATPEQLDPFFDPEQVRAWFTGPYRRAHVGLLTGRGTGGGLLVIDLDIRKPGEEITDRRFADATSGADVLEHLAADAAADWPDTYTVATPSTGVHLYYAMPPGEPLGCSTRRHPLIDTRGHGGLVVAPGSYSTAQGVAYRRITPPGMLPQPLPDWIHRLLAPPVTEPTPGRGRLAVPQTGPRADRYAAAALNALAADVAAAAKGHRWKALTAATFRLAELSPTAPGILTAAAVETTLATAAAAGGTNPAEATRIIRGAWNKARRGASA